MTEQELISSYYDALDALNGNFEFWLTGTFAVLLAVHFAGNNLSRFLKLLLVTLYLLSSLLFLGRLANAGGLATQLAETLYSEGSIYSVDYFISGPTIGILYIVIIIGGVAGTIYYVSTASKQES